jgi:hypothetical protein
MGKKRHTCNFSLDLILSFSIVFNALQNLVNSELSFSDDANNDSSLITFVFKLLTVLSAGRIGNFGFIRDSKSAAVLCILYLDAYLIYVNDLYLS